SLYGGGRFQQKLIVLSQIGRPQAQRFVSQRKPQHPLRQKEGKRSVVCWRRPPSCCSTARGRVRQPPCGYPRFLGLQSFAPLSAAALTDRSANTSGAGKLGTTSASPSLTLAFAAASRLASISLINSIPRSICSVVIALMPPECSNFISRGTSKAHILRYAAG